ncbi:MAG TPA: hypothetical protein VGL12_06765 [Roseiarcus sp.]
MGARGRFMSGVHGALIISAALLLIAAATILAGGRRSEKAGALVGRVTQNEG